MLRKTPEEVKSLISKGKIKVCVLGLGYIGAPTASAFALAGANVIGYDINKSTVEKINSGVSPISDLHGKSLLEKAHRKGNLKATNDPEELKDIDLFLVCVPTPIDSMKRPNLNPLINASRTIGENIKEDALVIVESTVWPGTTEEIVLPIIEETSGLKASKEFGLAHCPERIDVGNPEYHLLNIPRVVGGIDERSTDLSQAVYKAVLDAEIYKVKNSRIAESVKLLENTYRDVNIALVNELARIFERLDIDIVEVIQAACTKPFAFQPHYPGAGVGGHCIPVDPYYLVYKASEVGIEPLLLLTARKINEYMPHHIVTLVMEALNEIKKPIRGTKIAVLGLTYKGDVKDVRESPALPIINDLKSKGAVLSLYDPFLNKEEILDYFGINASISVEDACKEAFCLLLITAHSEFKKLDLRKISENMKKPSVVVDGRNILDPNEVIENDLLYIGVGRRYLKSK